MSLTSQDWLAGYPGPCLQVEPTNKQLLLLSASASLVVEPPIKRQAAY